MTALAEQKWQAEQYAQDVVSGKIVACHWVKRACQRHIDDLTHGHERGLRFDAAAAEKVLTFFGVLKHSKGEWAGRPVVLEPWQQFFLWVLFGWKRDDGLRRFRTAYISVARKNGKSTIAAGVGLYLLAADGEPGAEVYSAATKRDQARITHAEAVRMVKKSPMLRKRIGIFKDNLHIENTAAKFEPLGADSDTMDGLNVHGAVIDELHAHKNRDTWDVLDTATGSRRQPLLFGITTAGYDRQSLCWQLNEYAEKILDGVIEDDSYFALIFGLDADDDWQDEACWIKANPNLGISKKWDDMRRKSRRAADMPAALNSFKRLELNVWTQSVTKWINLEHWRACGEFAIDWDALIGRVCYGALDLSSTIDITAWCLIFPPETMGDPYIVLMRFWIPEDNMPKRVKDDRVPYDAWVRAGWIAATPGNTVDYDWIFDQVDDDAHDFTIKDVAFDRWGAARVVNELQKKGLTMVEFGQGFVSMSPPMKELERLILSHQIAHGNNPVLTWMADNLVAAQDPAGNLKPDKAKSREKIDGMVALVMAVDRATRNANVVAVVPRVRA